MKSTDIKITADGQIFAADRLVGFIDDDRVFVFTPKGSRELGRFDHRSEVVGMILEELA